jgi:hypothetical protein
VHTALVEKPGRKVAVSTSYCLLARHGWRKVQLNIKHPENDPASQAEFKNCHIHRNQIRQDKYGTNG